MLDAIHGKVNSKILNFKNIMSAVNINKCKNAGMEIYLKENFASKEHVNAFAKKIEMLKFKYFISKYQIFYENIGQVIHPNYINENKIIENRTRIIIPPNDLVPWCIRFEFNISRMISQFISIEDIYLQIIKNFPYVYVIHETLNSTNVLMRVYLRQEAVYKYKLTESLELKNFVNDLLDLTVRGVYGIQDVEVTSKEITEIVNSELKTKTIYYLITEGSNLAEILLMPEVDTSRTKSNVIKEMYEIFGITATRNLVVDGLINSVSGAYYSHYTIFADEMCATHEFTGLNRNGSAARGTSICQLIADSSYMRFLKMAAKKGTIDLNNGPNSAMIMGTTGKIGTNFNEICINEEFYENFLNTQQNDLENI
jgi:DNA-directed RNA polymerase II subunit RPB1